MYRTLSLLDYCTRTSTAAVLRKTLHHDKKTALVDRSTFGHNGSFFAFVPYFMSIFHGMLNRTGPRHFITSRHAANKCVSYGKCLGSTGFLGYFLRNKNMAII